MVKYDKICKNVYKHFLDYIKSGDYITEYIEINRNLTDVIDSIIYDYYTENLIEMGTCELLNKNGDINYPSYNDIINKTMYKIDISIKKYKELSLLDEMIEIVKLYLVNLKNFELNNIDEIEIENSIEKNLDNFLLEKFLNKDTFEIKLYNVY